MRKAPGNIERARKLAKTLKHRLASDWHHDVPLHACQQSIASGSGRTNWQDLKKHIGRQGSPGQWNKKLAVAALASTAMIPTSVAEAALGHLDLLLRGKPRKLQTVADHLLDTELAKVAEISQWNGLLSALMETQGFGELVDEAAAKAHADPAAFAEAAIRELSQALTIEMPPDFRNAYEGIAFHLASRPRSPEWAALGLFSVAKLARDHGSEERAMKEDVWTEEMMSFMRVLPAVKGNDPDRLADELWMLPDWLRHGTSELIYMKALVLVVQVEDYAQRSGTQGWLVADEIVDIDVARTGRETPVSATRSGFPFALEYQRWHPCGAGDYDFYFPDEEFAVPTPAWIRSAYREQSADAIGTEGLPGLDVEGLGVWADRTRWVLLIGTGLSPVDVTVLAGANVEVKVNRSDKPSMRVTIHQLAVKSGLPHRDWHRVAALGILYNLDRDLRELQHCPGGSAPVTVTADGRDPVADRVVHELRMMLDFKADFSAERGEPRALAVLVLSRG